MINPILNFVAIFIATLIFLPDIINFIKDAKKNTKELKKVLKDD